MFQYVLALLLINTYYQSLGNPIPINAENHSISDSLLALAKQCGNKFISDQIRSKIPECNLPVPPYNDLQFRCLMFYDINKQLCSTVADLNLPLNEDFGVKMNESQDINTFCTMTKDFVFTNMSDYVRYKTLGDHFIKMPTHCGNVCGYNDITNEEVNYFCKYYKWGLDLLKSKVNSTSSGISSNAAIPAADNDANSGDISVTVNSSNIRDLITKTGNVLKQMAPEVQTSETKSTSEKIDQHSEAPKTEVKLQTTKQTKEVEKSDTELNIDNLEDPLIALPKDLLSSTEHARKPGEEKDDKEKLETSISKIGQDVAINLQQKETVIENPAKTKLKLPDDMDYPGLEDDNGDSQGNEGDDHMEENNELEQEKDSSFVEKKTFDVVQKGGYYPHTEPEEFSEDDDHFFPFFLTAVVLVVLLYILYHNKNKVSKIFFGLILEGPKSRRRNSRGHAYSRLDTLEQAMSANTAAPPSKIIY